MAASASPAALDNPSAATLPIATCRDELIAALQRHRVLVVLGETGSGKTTQLPQYLLDAALHLRASAKKETAKDKSAKGAAGAVAVSTAADTAEAAEGAVSDEPGNEKNPLFFPLPLFPFFDLQSASSVHVSIILIATLFIYKIICYYSELLFFFPFPSFPVTLFSSSSLLQRSAFPVTLFLRRLSLLFAAHPCF